MSDVGNRSQLRCLRHQGSGCSFLQHHLPPAQNNRRHADTRMISGGISKKQQRNSNFCLAYVWTALCFHGNAFRFVFDLQKRRDETRSFNNHISVKQPAWMAHASIKAKLFVILANLIFHLATGRASAMCTLMTETTTLNHGKRAAGVSLHWATVSINNRCNHEAGTHCFHSLIKSVTNAVKSFAVITRHNYLWQVKLSSQGPITDLFKAVSRKH